MNDRVCFGLTDLVVVVCILLLLGAIVVPTVFCFAGRSRESVCRNNLKLIGTGLELWQQHAGRYPFYDYPSGQDLQPWPDILVMQGGYTPQKLLAMSTILQQNFHLTPEDFIKTVDDDKIFMCPSDHPHPHKINQQRSSSWAFNDYVYSYTLSYPMQQARYHTRADQQLLSADGLWPWSHNFSGEWVTNPNASYDTGGWWCNTIGYWHKGNSANVLLRDLHIQSYKYPPDTTKVFAYEPGEALNAIKN
jgi:hypothetical protein